MAEKKFANLDNFSRFLNHLKNLFATKTELEAKANSSHNHDSQYYTKTQIDSMELITVQDIDAICGANIQIASASEVTF
jgi:hypothetical protein